MAARQRSVPLHPHPASSPPAGASRWRRLGAWCLDAASGLPAWAMGASWARGSLVIGGALLVLVIPRLMDVRFIPSSCATALLTLGMALGIGDAARSEERRVGGVLGFVLNILAFLAWAVSSVILKALSGEEH